LLRIRIVAVGDHKDRWVQEACDHYTKLISRFAELDLVLVSGPKPASSLPPAQIMTKEAQVLSRELAKEYLIALSDKGKKQDSETFAKEIARLEMVSGGKVTFVIGGAYGLAPDVLKRADTVYSLSPLTFSHQLARVVLLEQLYRGFSILRGTSYHK
jgi:23S rRNA (pseudouridine1915-N3)-methyltransferase